MLPSAAEAAGSERRPAIVERCLDRALTSSPRSAQQVRLVQEGEMYQRRGGRAVRFTAVEWLAVECVAFRWEARFRLGPLISLKVRDSYVAGCGALTISALGVPARRQSGATIDVGEAYRYLAELPWVPQAMACNDELHWRALGPDEVEVSAAVGEVTAAVVMRFDAGGDVVESRAAARPGEIEGRTCSAEWGGRFSSYASLGGMRVPTRAEVYWHLAEGEFVYWRAEVIAAEPVDAPLESPQRPAAYGRAAGPEKGARCSSA